MSATLTSLGIPVVSDRRWTNALWQDPVSGDWYYIAQFYNYPNSTPTEWVVMNLRTGAYTIDIDNPYTPGARGMYCSGTRYLIANQKRAPNDRIFFPALDGWLWYFDPSDKRIHDFGPVTSTTPVDDSLYIINFNVDGSKLIWGTIAAPQLNNGHDCRPRFGTFDPVTLTSRDYGRIGSTSRTLAGYCYYTHSDGVGSAHAYAIVGQEFWEVVDVNLTTGVMTTLATTGTGGRMFFVEKPEGLVIQVYENYRVVGETLVEHWIVDGVLYNYTAGYDPATLPFTARSVSQYNSNGSGLTTPPAIDEMTLPSAVGWRPNGSSADYTRNPFSLSYTSPIVLESLMALDDGTLLGNAQQYQGFFRYHPSTGVMDYFGAFNQLSEGDARLLVGSIAYLSGYPNGVLFAYDRTKAWTQTGRFSALNPAYEGAYSNGDTFSGIKHAEVLAYGSTRNRVYMVGTRDRSGFGAGVGWYNAAGGVSPFGGTFTNLDLYTDDVGIVVFDGLSKVVIGGRISVGDAQLITYDLDLTELSRATPIVGMSSTGRLYRSSESNVLIGFSASAKKVYRWNVQTSTLLSQVDLTSYGTIGTITQDAADTVLIVLGNGLYRVNLRTLAVTSLGDMGVRPTHIAVAGGIIYGVYSTALYQITPEGGAPPSGGSSGGSGGSGSGGTSTMSTDVPRSDLTSQQLMKLASFERGLSDALDSSFGSLIEGVAALESEVTPSDIQVANGNAAAITAGQPVYLTANGIVDLAKADAIATAVVLGIVSEATIPASSTGQSRVNDYLDATPDQWDAVCGTIGGLVGGVTYYLSATTAGKLTAVAPSADGQCVVPVILAITPTRAKIIVRPPVQL